MTYDVNLQIKKLKEARNHAVEMLILFRNLSPALKKELKILYWHVWHSQLLMIESILAQKRLKQHLLNLTSNLYLVTTKEKDIHDVRQDKQECALCFDKIERSSLEDCCPRCQTKWDIDWDIDAE